MNPINFIHELEFEALSADVVHMAKRVLLDTLGVAITGRQTKLADIIYDYAAVAHGGRDQRLWLDGRLVSKPGAALAHAMACDAVDMHDGYQLCMGHAGAALIPTALAILHDDKGSVINGRDLITTLVVGYEVAVRAGLALHATACDYHTSGAWNALGCAAMYARRYGLSAEQTRHALGIAEYHGPRSQMMRCIDFPTMLKDGSGWGAMTGVSAGMLAAAGFTGAPAVTVEDLTNDNVTRIWSDLGQKFIILRQYFKKYAVCYWAQPAVAAVLTLQKAHELKPENITKIIVHTFHEATRLAVYEPKTTEAAQYSLPFPVAAALIHGQLTARELTDDQLFREDVMKLAHTIEMIEETDYNQVFPNDRLCHVVIETAAGKRYTSETTRPPWTEKEPPSDNELTDKFNTIASQTLPRDQVQNLIELIWNLENLDSAETILHQLQLG